MHLNSSPVMAAPGTWPRGRSADAMASSVRAAGLRRGFSLVEMLVVIAVIVVLVGLITPAFTQVNAARQLTAAAYDISGALDNARAYAKANGTYTWVGFYEENFNGPDGIVGTGRVVVSAVASKDATAMYASTDNNPPPLDPKNLVQLNKLLKIDNVHLSILGTTEIPARGKVPDASDNLVNVPNAYQLGDSSSTATDGFAQRSATVNKTTFSYPLLVPTPTYKFLKIIQFNPLGDATKIVDSPVFLMEIGLRVSRNGVIDTATKNCAAIQVAGIGGQTRIFQP